MGSNLSSSALQENNDLNSQFIRLYFLQNVGIYSMEIDREQTVKSLKNMLRRSQDSLQVILEFKKKILEDDKKIKDYPITNDSTIKILYCQTPMSKLEKRIFIEFSKTQRPALIIYEENESLNSFTKKINKIIEIKVNHVIMYKNEEIDEEILRKISNDATVQLKTDYEAFNDFLYENEYPIIDFKEISIYPKSPKEGGFGKVFEAKFQTKTVAIKEYNDLVFSEGKKINLKDTFSEIRNIFIANAKITKSNKCYGVSIQSNTKIFTVHEYIESNLKEKVEKKLTIEQKHQLTKQLLEVMKEMFEKKILHRDIKPTNIFYSEETGIILGDFSTLRLLKNKETMTKNLLMSMNYAPPEIVRASEEENYYLITNFYDIWSLGKTLHYIYNEKTLPDSEIRDIVRKEEIPDKIYEVIEKCLVIDPHKRITPDEILKILYPTSP